jgi:hypothetical protein
MVPITMLNFIPKFAYQVSHRILQWSKVILADEENFFCIVKISEWMAVALRLFQPFGNPDFYE